LRDNFSEVVGKADDRPDLNCTVEGATILIALRVMHIPDGSQMNVEV
jgi:hypothetical protein